MTLSIADTKASAGALQRTRALTFGTLVRVWLPLCLTIGTAPADSPPPILREPQRGTFLVADKSLIDPNFSRTVVLLTDHGIMGSIGLIINKSSGVSVVSTLPELDGLQDPAAKMRFGGPLQIHSVRLLARSASEIPSAQRLFEDVYFVNSTAALRSILGKHRSRTVPTINYYAGYAGWSPGQLAAEIARGDWHLIKADGKTIFEPDIGTIWLELIEKLEGIWVLMDNAVVADNP